MSLPDAPVEIRTESIGVRGTLARRIGWIALVALIVPVLFWLLVPAVTGPWFERAGSLMQVSVMLSPFGMLAALLLSAYAGSAPGTLRIRDRKLTVERGRRRIEFPLASVTRGWVAPLSSETRVEIEMQTGDLVTARVRTPAEGREVLEAAGVDVTRRTLRARFGNLATQGAVAIPSLLVCGCVIGTSLAEALESFGIQHGVAGAIVIAVVAAATAGMSRALGPRDVVVGSDGIEMQGVFLREFIPFTSIRQVAPYALDGVETDDSVVNCTDGREIRLPTGLMTGVQREVFFQRIREAMSARLRTPDLEPRLALLDRNGRSVPEWRRSLAELVDGEKHYRSAALTAEEIARTLGDAAVSAERRIGAAIALASIDPEASPRIRIAADATANQPVRIALEQIGDGQVSDAVLERAVAVRKA